MTEAGARVLCDYMGEGSYSAMVLAEWVWRAMDEARSDLDEPMKGLGLDPPTIREYIDQTAAMALERKE